MTIPATEPPGPCRDEPWAYFITFACYGARLHGDARGSVDRHHNGFGGRMLDVWPLREAFEKRRMALAAATLDTVERGVVLWAIRDVCNHEKWTLYGVHVRSTHVHVLVAGKPSPETVMGKLKAYASRALNKRFGHRSKRWTRHGSTRRVWSPAALEATLRYVLDRQGERMACYENLERWSHLG